MVVVCSEAISFRMKLKLVGRAHKPHKFCEDNMYATAISWKIYIRARNKARQINCRSMGDGGDDTEKPTREEFENTYCLYVWYVDICC